MPSNPPKSQPERNQTDESLRLERHKTDSEFGDRRAQIEERSDAVVQQAHDRAADLLEGARDRADAALAKEGSSERERQAIEKERKQEDAVLEQERKQADEKLAAERVERMRALASLLRLEREQTDERLLVERARGDAAVAARDDFMGMVSHDVRTLLGGIALASSIQIQNATSDEAGQLNLKTAQKIQRFTARINRLIGDLLDVASIEGGRFSIACESSDAAALVQESMGAFLPSAAEKGLALTSSVPPGPLTAMFDHDRILQVVANLLSNAIKFTASGGALTLRLETIDGTLRISVSDTGEGIADDQLESIFERFWQVTQGDKRGSGLGLFISKCIVLAHGGRIWAESTPGKGSTFFFTLPLTSGSLPIS